MQSDHCDVFRKVGTNDYLFTDVGSHRRRFDLAEFEPVVFDAVRPEIAAHDINRSGVCILSFDPEASKKTHCWYDKNYLAKEG